MTNKEEPRVIDTVLQALEERVCTLESIIKAQRRYTLADLIDHMAGVHSESFCRIDGLRINDAVAIYAYGDYFLAFNTVTEGEERTITASELYYSIKKLQKKYPNMITNKIYKSFDYASLLARVVSGVENPDDKFRINFLTTEA